MDAIGNLESRDATLADCMIELLRCAKHFSEVEESPNDDTEFTCHAKQTFKREFLAMNTNLHWFVLYLHPLCRRLAISQASKSRTFADAQDMALTLAQKWKFSEQSALKLLNNLRDYNLGKTPFAGGTKDARSWWEELPINVQDCPLKGLAVTLFGLVPHSAEVERLFSSLGGIQGVRRSRLDVRTFEKMGRMRCHLNSLLHEKAKAEGRSLRRTRAHMHTREGGGIDEQLLSELQDGLTIRPVMSSTVQGTDIELATEEEGSIEELNTAFDELEASKRPETDSLEEIDATHPAFRDVEALEIGDLYDLSALKGALDGTAPMVVEEDHRVHHNFEGNTVSWDKDTLIRRGATV